MEILKKLNSFQESKISWFSLFFGSLILLSCSIYFQHVLLLEPCILCIYQRISIMLIFISSLIPLLFGTSRKITFIPYLLWICSSSLGLWSAISQWRETYLAANNPFYFSQCGQGLEKYLPILESNDFLNKVFIAKGICSEIDWSFAGLSMHHYMTFVFGLFLVSSLLFFLISLIKAK